MAKLTYFDPKAFAEGEFSTPQREEGSTTLGTGFAMGDIESITTDGKTKTVEVRFKPSEGGQVWELHLTTAELVTIWMSAAYDESYLEEKRRLSRQ